MRQAGVAEPPEIVGVPVAWDEVSEDATGEQLQVPRPRIVGSYPRPSRQGGRRALLQPAPNPVAAEVADRYAKALSLDPDVPAPPPPPGPRRSRAAMRDREMRPSLGRRDRDSRAGAASPTPRPRATEGHPVATSRPRPTVGRPAATPLPRATETRAEAGVGGVPGRRTVTIRGRGAERELGWGSYESRRRPPTSAHERPGFRPDRAAMWAVLLGLLLVLVAATSSHAAVFAHAIH